MAIYIIIFVSSLLILLIRNAKIKKISSNLLLLVMTLTCVLRSEDIGSDTLNYVSIYDSVYGLAYYIEKDPLFGLIGLLVHLFSGNYHIFQILLGIITYFPLFIVFNKYSDNIAISVLIFIFATNRYFFETFNIIRQSAAAAYLLWCWVMVDKKKYWKALSLFLIAAGFHHTSWICFPIAIVALKFKVSIRTIGVFIFATLIFTFIFSNMEILVSLQKIFLSNETIGKYDTYEKELAKTIWGLLPIVLPYACITIIGYRQYVDNYIFRLFAYGSIFTIFISVLPMAYRISYGIIILELLIFPIMLKSGSNNKLLTQCIIICLVIFSFTDFLNTCYLAKLVPYEIFKL